MAKSTPDTETPPAPPAPTDELAKLRQELADANAKITQLTTAKAQLDEDEKLIAAKMAKGLTRAQAISSIRSQRVYDESAVAKLQRERLSKKQAEKAAGK